MKNIVDGIKKKFNKQVTYSIIFFDKENGKNYLFLREQFVDSLIDYAQDRYSGEKSMTQFFNKLETEIPGSSPTTFKRVIKRLVNASIDPNNTTSDKTCIYYLEKFQELFDTQLLQEYNTQSPRMLANQYIHSLVEPLFQLMLATDFYNYFKNTTVDNLQAYRIQLRMIEEIVTNDFFTEIEDYWVWQEILIPLKYHIYDKNFPGIEEGIWTEMNPALRYFDIVYEIAQNSTDKYFSLQYEKCFKFSIGETLQEVSESLDKQEQYFKMELSDACNDWKEKNKLFANELINTYHKIIKEKFQINE